jgi:hypothetical protein
MIKDQLKFRFTVGVTRRVALTSVGAANNVGLC